MMTYEDAKAHRENLVRAHDDAAANLKSVCGDERGPMGLTPDHIKSTPQWKNAFRAERAAFERMRQHNFSMVKTFKVEMAADRKAARKAAA